MRLALMASIVFVALWTLFIIFLISLIIIWAIPDDLNYALIYIGCVAAGLLSGYILNEKTIPEPYLLVGGGLLVLVTLVGSYLLFLALVVFGAGLGTVLRRIHSTLSGDDFPTTTGSTY